MGDVSWKNIVAFSVWEMGPQEDLGILGNITRVGVMNSIIKVI